MKPTDIFTMEIQKARLKKLLTQTYKSISEKSIDLHGAAIAYYSIFSAAPLMYILITLAGILGNQQTINVLTGYLNQLFGHNLAQTLISIANAAHRQSTGTFVSLLSIVTLIIGATTAILQLRNSFNIIWDVEEREINSILLNVINRVVSVVVIFVLMIIYSDPCC